MTLVFSSGKGANRATGRDCPGWPTMADIVPGLVDVDTPVDADDITARGMKFAEKAASTGAEMNDRDAAGADTFDQCARIGLNIADVIFGAERAHPAVEDLNGASSGADLYAAKSPSTSTSLPISRRHITSLPYISFLVLRNVFEGPPSIM